MTFPEAVRTCLSKYADFSGRARRSEYWWFFLFTVIVSIVAGIIDGVVGSDVANGYGVVTIIVALALLLPSLAVSARRLHDTGKSGWWILLGIIPLVGFIVLLVFYVQDSHGDNKYGPNPKAQAHSF
jgi:uncharacterized membrane protein YhaH (DUF805 family)